MTDAAADVIDFVVEVFGATDVPEARTLDQDGLILHSEIRIGDSTLTIADRKADWPYTPAFTRVYVDDVDATLDRAVQQGASVVTRPTDFLGDVLARFADPRGTSGGSTATIPRSPTTRGPATPRTATPRTATPRTATGRRPKRATARPTGRASARRSSRTSTPH
ncbi:VOC family protein [Oerskovia sp. M15]